MLGPRNDMVFKKTTGKMVCKGINELNILILKGFYKKEFSVPLFEEPEPGVLKDERPLRGNAISGALNLRMGLRIFF
jgi:hypothetical protein